MSELSGTIVRFMFVIIFKKIALSLTVTNKIVKVRRFERN